MDEGGSFNRKENFAWINNFVQNFDIKDVDAISKMW